MTAPHIPPAPAGEAAVSEAEVEREVERIRCMILTALYPGDAWAEASLSFKDAVNGLAEDLAARARAAAQGAGAQPVACSVCGGSGVEEVYGGHGTVLELPCSACAAPPDAPRPDIEAARREEREQDGWHDIATAPRDGTYVLVCGPHENRGHYVDATRFWGDRWAIEWMSGFGPPTHWRRLPDALRALGDRP